MNWQRAKQSYLPAMTMTKTPNWPDLAGKIINDMHILPVRVYYEDTDFSGFVYHANYLKFCERARSDCLRLLEIHHHELEANSQSGFVVRQMTCDFLKPARIDNVLEVQTRFKSAKGARMFIMQSVWHGDNCLFKADVTAALIDGKGRPRRFTPQMLDAFARIYAS